MAPAFLKKLSSRGIPLNALIMTIAISAFSLLTSVVAAETVYLWLISISGVITIIVWMSICISQFFFRKHYLADGGKLEDLKFKNATLSTRTNSWFWIVWHYISKSYLYPRSKTRHLLYCTIYHLLLYLLSL